MKKYGWQQPHWQQKATHKGISYTRTFIVHPFVDEKLDAKFKYSIETENDTTILSLECRLIAKAEEKKTDVTQRFYLDNGQPAQYNLDKYTSPQWPTKEYFKAAQFLPSNFLAGKSYQDFESLARQVPSLEQSLQQLSSYIDQKYNINPK